MLYDPPNGWKYGFPKKFKGGNLRLALIEDGYPPELIDDVVLNHCRFLGSEGQSSEAFLAELKSLGQ